MLADLERILIPRDQIARRVEEIGADLARDLLDELRAEGSSADAPDRIVMVPILIGSIVFLADLVRHLPMKLSLSVVAVSSYPGKSLQSKGARIKSELPPDLRGKHVVLVDDILDSGGTLALVRSLVLEQEPASVRVCVLLSKDVKRVAPIEPDYVGFCIPNEFVVGYGLDYDGYYRNLPDIGVLRTSEGEESHG